MREGMKRVEMARAFRSAGFRISLLLGLCLTLSEAASRWRAVQWGMEYERRKGISSYNPVSLFTIWFPMDPRSWRVIAFYLLFPLLAALPFAASYLQDRRSGYLGQILLRTRKREYFFAKYLAVFVSGGTVVTVPLILNFVATSLYLPWKIPDSISGSVAPSSILAELFYSHPFFYTCVLLLLTFVTAGLYATLSLGITSWLEQSFSAFLFPFLLSLVIYYVALPFGLNSLVSFYVLVPFRSMECRLWVYLLLLAVFAFAGISGFYRGLFQDERIK